MNASKLHIDGQQPSPLTSRIATAHPAGRSLPDGGAVHSSCACPNAKREQASFGAVGGKGLSSGALTLWGTRFSRLRCFTPRCEATAAGIRDRAWTGLRQACEQPGLRDAVRRASCHCAGGARARTLCADRGSHGSLFRSAARPASVTKTPCKADTSSVTPGFDPSPLAIRRGGLQRHRLRRHRAPRTGRRGRRGRRVPLVEWPAAGRIGRHVFFTVTVIKATGAVQTSLVSHSMLQPGLSPYGTP